MPLAADFAITVGSEVSYNEFAQLSFSVFNNLNAPDLRGDVGGLWENFVIAERMKRNHNQRPFPNCYFWRSHQKQEIDYLEELNGACASMNFSIGAPSSNESFRAIFRLMDLRPCSILEMCCRGIPPRTSPN